MARIKSRSLYELVKSMSKNEKRYFKLLYGGSGDGEDKKMLILFDYMNKQKEFDEDSIPDKLPSLKTEQLSNMKAYLYDKLLQAIRLFNAPKILDLQIREQIDYAQLLFSRRLYTQGMNSLKKARKMALVHDNLELQLEIIKLEKSVLMQTIDHDTVDKVDRIIEEARTINKRINNINTFSNLSIKLNSYYTKIGYIRGEADFLRVKEFFNSNIPDFTEEELSISEKLNLYKLYVGYYLFIQDFRNGYEYALKLVKLFDTHEELKETSTEQYIKSLNNLLIAQYKLDMYNDFAETNKILHAIAADYNQTQNESIRIRLLKYYYIHEINKYFITGDFTKGVEVLMKSPDTKIYELLEVVDKHSELIINYKLACLYFGASDFHGALKWLNRIINIPDGDIREDLHCFARILNLICHYELGNYDVIKYYIISTYRFLLKKEDLHLFQKFILKFLKDLNQNTRDKELYERFVRLKSQLIPLVNSTYEKRAFIYFDIISWLESKIEKRLIQDVIQEKVSLKYKSDKAS